jgi:hypothetical protein
VFGAVEVFGRVLVLRRIAAADVAAVEASAQVHPAVAALQALFAALGRDGGGVIGGLEMFAKVGHGDPPSSKERSRPHFVQASRPRFFCGG